MNKFIDILKKNKDEIIKPVVVLLAICIVIPLALSLTNMITVDRIATLAEENQNKTMSRLIEAESYEQKGLAVVDMPEPVDYFVAKNGEEIVGYIFVTSAKGYGGEVSVMTAVNTDGTVKAVEILDASGETPGLGQNITRNEFTERFKGKPEGITAVKNGAVAENNQIDAWTGATISSKAVTKAVNEALENYKAVALENNDTAEKEVTGNE